MPASITQIKDAMIKLYDEANKQNLAVFDELLAPTFVSFGGAGFQDLVGAEAFKDLYKTFLAAFPDLSFRVDDLVAEDNFCAVRGTLSGMHEGNFMGFADATHKRITWTGTALFRFDDDGLMDARWQEFDGLGMFQQMGLVPTPPGMDVKPPQPHAPHFVGDGMSSPSANKETMRRFIEEVWNNGNLDVADEIFHPDATSPSAPMLPTGGAGVRMIAGMFRSAMPDYRMEIIDLLADGDRVFARFTQSGTQTGELMGVPPSGRKATWGEMGILRFEGGKVVESWYDVDMLGMMQQLGVGGDGGAAKG